jgi:hypothetical protein
MGRYSEILEKINNSSAEFEKLPKSKVENELSLGSVPQDYIDFLTEVGFGSISNGYFMFYEGLIAADNIYDSDVNPEIKNVFLFGDNFTGDAIGFLSTDNWSIVEIWHDNLSIVPREEKTFMELVNKIFLKEL